MKLVVIVFALAFVTLSRARFTFNELNEDPFIRRQVDGSLCPRRIKFNTQARRIRASDIRADDEDCKGNGIIAVESFGSSVPNTASSAVKFFARRNRDVESFLVGTLSGGNIVCQDFILTNGEELIFLEPDDDVENFRWEDVFSGQTPLSRDDNTLLELDDDDKFLIISDRCFYSEAGANVCFPADAQIRLQDGSVRRMDEVSIGDNVQVSPNSFSPVFAWTHADAHTRYRFVQLVTERGSISLTPSHYIYADGVATAAGKVKVGMKLEWRDGSHQTVSEKKYVWKTGLYNPQTINGDIVVNEFVVTTYTTALEPSMAHALLAPVRAAFMTVNKLFAVSQKSGL